MWAITTLQTQYCFFSDLRRYWLFVSIMWPSSSSKPVISPALLFLFQVIAAGPCDYIWDWSCKRLVFHTPLRATSCPEHHLITDLQVLAFIFFVTPVYHFQNLVFSLHLCCLMQKDDNFFKNKFEKKWEVIYFLLCFTTQLKRLDTPVK